jgi:hypothetical protein
MAYAIAAEYTLHYSEYLHKPTIISDYRFNRNNFAKKFVAGTFQNLPTVHYFSPLLTSHTGLK